MCPSRVLQEDPARTSPAPLLWHNTHPALPVGTFMYYLTENIEATKREVCHSPVTRPAPAPGHSGIGTQFPRLSVTGVKCLLSRQRLMLLLVPWLPCLLPAQPHSPYSGNFSPLSPKAPRGPPHLECCCLFMDVPCNLTSFSIPLPSLTLRD